MKICKNVFQNNSGLKGRFCDSSDVKFLKILYVMEHMWRNLVTQTRKEIFQDRHYCYI